MNKYLLVLVIVAASLSGCEQEKVPEPSAAMCTPDAFYAALNEMHSEASRTAFTEECKVFQKANQLRQWQFKPSPKDNY